MPPWPTPTPKLSLRRDSYLAEVFNIIYLGPSGEIKPQKQLGTIKVNDGHLCQYLYSVEDVDTSRPPIQPGDELILTGPNKDSISSGGPLRIDIDLFCGDFKDSICYEGFPGNRGKHNSPLDRRILSKDGFGEILVLYALFNNAMKAHLQIELLTNDNPIAANVHGVVAASISDIDQPEFSSMLFLKKPGFGINVGHKEQIPLTRSVIAVPYESTLFLDFHLLSDDGEIVKGSVDFHAKPGSETKKRFSGNKAGIVATVTWMGAA